MSQELKPYRIVKQPITHKINLSCDGVNNPRMCYKCIRFKDACPKHRQL